MALVGDLIRDFRVAMPDPEQTLPTPTVATPTGTGGGSLPSGTPLFVVVTALTQWGESYKSTEVNASPGGGNSALSIVATLPPGSTSGRAYYGTVSGQQNQWIALTAAGIGTITSMTGGTAGAPPTINTAFLPDTDGADIGAFQVYSWMNSGLNRLTDLTGGIADATGINTTVKQQYYIIPGRWLRFTTVLYDQYQVTLGSRDDILYRFNVSGVSGVIAQEIRSGQSVVSLNPTPNLAGATATVTAPIASGDTSFTVNDASGFRPNGIASIDSETFLFSNVNAVGAAGSITGIIRAVGGTVAATHSNGATVQELKLGLRGYRYPNLLAVGNAGVTLDIPPSWESVIETYMLARARDFEQQFDEADKLMARFEKRALEIKMNTVGVVRKIQQGPPGPLLDTYGYGIGRVIVR